MNLEDQKQKLLRFFGSGAGTRFGSFASPITRRISLIPKRSIPQQILSRFQSSTSSGMDDGITTTQRDVSSLGKVTLNLEQTKNNLERILQVISEDYKNTQEQNKKEADEYRKRIANRGRIFGKKELGDRKTDLLGGIKKYVGSFFSGAGGAIRGLASFNLLEAILNKDPKKIISSLLGIGMTYLPAIGGLIGLSVAKSLGKRLLGLGGARAAAGGATGAAGLARGAGSLGKIGRFGGKAALVAGGIGLASSLFNKDGGDQTQQRLEELTQQQKASVEPGSITSVPQDDLKRFEALNNKFEKALDFLLGKQKEPQKTGGGGGGGSGPGPGPGPGNVSQDVTAAVSDPNVKAFLDVLAKPESGGAYDRKFGGGTFDDYSELQSGSTPFGRYQFKPTTYNPIASRLGISDVSPESQDIIAVQYMKDLGVLDEVQSGDPNKIQSAINRLKGSTWTGLQTYKANEALQYFNRRASYYGAGGASPAVSAASMSLRNLPAPSSRGPTILPMAVPQQAAPQQSSAAVGNNDTVPSIDTTYPENFLALYSKLIYQIV